MSARDKNYLRFLSWPNGDLALQPLTYNMSIHIFGATSSPSCAQFSLLECAEDQSVELHDKVKSVIVNNCLFSVSSVEEAVFLAKQVSLALKNCGLNLTKWLSNNPEVLQALPQDKLCKSILNFSGSEQVCERIVGVEWDVSKYNFVFRVNCKTKPPTRRGMLSVLSSVYDPLGFAAPTILVAKVLLQELCCRKYGWHELMTDGNFETWQNCLFGTTVKVFRNELI